MAQLTVRKLDDDVVRRLKIRAAENGRSAEAEVRSILEETLVEKRVKDFWKRADALRSKTAHKQETNSLEIIREMRENR